MATFYTSDSHFSHFNIIRYCNRPFLTIAEMNDTIINNFNSVIKPEDTLYHLGDFAFSKNYDYLVSLMNRINGKKVCIIGNHDREKFFKQMMIDNVITGYCGNLHTVIDGQSIYMTHRYKEFDNSKTSWTLYGHVHTTGGKLNNNLSYDVGVDNNNYFPVSFDQLKIIMEKTKRNIK